MTRPLSGATATAPDPDASAATGAAAGAATRAAAGAPGVTAAVTAATAPLFTAVSLGRISQAIVEQIRGLLHEGTLRVGDRLPSERELCQRFGVSRVTVREALRILEADGLVTVKVGARGGAFVSSPSSERFGVGLADLISLSPLTAVEVTEARMVFEIGLVPLVVERATEDDIANLREMTRRHLQALDSGSYTMTMSADFHVAVSACTHNQAIQMLLQSFHGPLLMSLLEASSHAPAMGRTGCAEHVAFIDAIAARDVARAHEIMYTHLRRTADRVRGPAGD